ncbi:sensor histidine kinase [Teredinibacter haidensis]|uniref:sensor histidine kinase n=1 Tax=Teredinibacter haidensis TaxID=2731755 RepID=UPI000949053C|nr:ATP-binding protein [Teredinibacter haidensis]
MTNIDYKAAYQRQKKARELADKLLEDKSRELYEANSTLTSAYNRLKHQKAQLLHQEKLASIGQLSAGVAHEINNPSAYVKSNLSALKKYRESLTGFIADIEHLCANQHSEKQFAQSKSQYDIDFLMDDFDDILIDSISGMEKIAGIVRSLKDFSRPDQDEKQFFSVNECIRNTLKLVLNEIKYKAEIVEHYGDTPDVLGYSGGFSQVVLNLLVNATHAIEEKGTITITTGQSDEGIRIDIADTGKGIAPADLLRIFDPFFSTKPAGQGTGLGLSISHGIIEKLGGRLRASSVLQQGSTFTILLPHTPNDAEAP